MAMLHNQAGAYNEEEVTDTIIMISNIKLHLHKVKLNMEKATDSMSPELGHH